MDENIIDPTLKPLNPQPERREGDKTILNLTVNQQQSGRMSVI
jgi:hypothetical protein